MRTGFTCPIHEQWIPEGLCPWCEPLTPEAPKELESKDALEALRYLFYGSMRCGGMIIEKGKP